MQICVIISSYVILCVMSFTPLFCSAQFSPLCLPYFVLTSVDTLLESRLPVLSVHVLVVSSSNNLFQAWVELASRHKTGWVPRRNHPASTSQSPEPMVREAEHSEHSKDNKRKYRQAMAQKILHYIYMCEFMEPRCYAANFDPRKDELNFNTSIYCTSILLDPTLGHQKFRFFFTLTVHTFWNKNTFRIIGHPRTLPQTLGGCQEAWTKKQSAYAYIIYGIS